MKNQWLQRSTGHVKIRVTEASAEDFINDCAKRGVVVWGITYEEEKMFTAHILLTDLSKLKKMAKHLPCRIVFIEKRGIPFVLNKLSRRKGMITGFAAFLLFLFVLSHMVWDIEIEGASPALEHDLTNAIHEMGITKGKLQYFLPSPEEIQQKLTNEIDEITWVGVTKQGSAYHFQIVEKEIVEEKPSNISGHLVAARKAVIHDLFVEKGKPMVTPNQVVEKGDILVSGLIGKEDNARQISAEGSVVGEFWYEVNMDVPLNVIIETLTGEVNRKHGIMIGKLFVPIWGLNGIESEHIVEETFTKRWVPFGFALPFGYRYVNEYEMNAVKEERMKEEAVSIAVKESEKRLLQQFSSSAEVVDEKVLHQIVDGGKVKVSLHLRIIDEIALKQPIIQGD
ncbi:sporulation protein YqfD [Salipaludibacillus keqinensis]|uniref:Sporulation protein YqfD n=1 Tax=Salipaludibacillus keqinensis TaxID=2045207 RepID=A0A323TI87_9BACI|nr:sporulation protein YqfD [Salipaludibacillus keqinensis]PYZ94250.1 sporulation protein YqfD [Salipaludibacillus keqinensis]